MGTAVLLVEDEARVQAVVQEGLRMAGYDVTPVENAEDALVCLARPEFRACIMDLMLPGMDGIELCEKLRARGWDLPILMLTARTEVSDRVTGLNAGADDYLVKPFAMDELVARVRALIRKHEGYQRTDISVGDLVIEPGTRRVSRAFGTIELSRKEYQLLEFLARYQGQPVNRNTIASEVWDGQTGSWSNLIDVFMNHLRKKIDPPGSPKLLHTVRGKGFMLARLDNEAV